MSSILETFYILFESNSKQIKQGAQEAGAATTTLEAEIASADAAVIAAGEHIARVFENVAIRIASAFAIERVIEFIGSVSELNAQLLVTATRLGINVSDLDAYGQAAERAGGTREGFAQTLDFLNRGIADIATKGTSRLKPFFDELKIQVTDAPHHVRPLLDILGDLADRLSGLDAQQRAGIAEKLGIDEGTVLLLAQGRRGLDDLVERQRALGVVTQEDAEKAHAFNIALQDLEQQFRHGATELGASLLPRLADFFRSVQTVFNYLAQHKGLVEGFFIGIAGVVSTIYFPAMVEAAAVTWGLLSPILAVVVPIAAVGAAIALLVDDVKNFLAGNKSVIGELSKSWPAVGESVRAAVAFAGNAFGWFVDLLKGEYALMSAILGLVGAAFAWVAGEVTGALKIINTSMANMFPFWTQLIHAFGGLLKWLVGLLADAAGWFVKFGASAVAVLPKALSNWAKGLGKVTVAVAAASGTPAAGTDVPRVAVLRPVAGPEGAQAGATLPPESDVARMVIKAQAAIKTADTSPVSAITNSTISNSRTGDRTLIFNGGPVTINAPTGDATDIADKLNKHLEDQVRQAVDHFDDGVAG